MIKKLILLLLVVCGEVVSANAWNSAVLHYDGHWNSDDIYFTKIDGNKFYIQLDGSVINNGSFYFRFAVKGDGADDPFVEKEPDTESHNVDQEVSTVAVSTNYNSWYEDGVHTKKAFYVSQDPNAGKVEIYLNYTNEGSGDWKWHVTAVALYKYTILWDNSETNWASVKAYTYDEGLNDHRKIEWLGKWNEVSPLTKNNDYYSVTFYGTSSVKAIFFNGDTQTQDLTVFDNGIYKGTTSYEPYAFSATLGKYGYTTFASSCPLNLDGINQGITAYYVANSPTTTIVKLTKATGNIAAGEGIILYGQTPNAEVTIPVAASGSEIYGNLLVGCPNGASLTKTTPGYENVYVLVNADKQAEFQKVKDWLDKNNTLTIPAGKAYLQATGLSAPSFSIELGDETTGIMETIRETTTNNQYYTLDGRRVAQPTKGLYIVNGKKVIIK